MRPRRVRKRAPTAASLRLPRLRRPLPRLQQSDVPCIWSCSLAPPAGEEDESIDDEALAEAEAVRRAQDVVTADVAAALYGRAAFGGLVKVRNVLGPRRTAWMHRQAADWCASGELKGPEHWNELQQGRDDVFCFPGFGDGSATQPPDAISFGRRLLQACCMQLSRMRPRDSAPPLRPGQLQLACYLPGGRGYAPHLDSHPATVADDATQHVQGVAARQVTAILYLQPRWETEWGGCFRAYAHSSADSASTSASSPASSPMSYPPLSPPRSQTPPGCVDTTPEGGTLLLFRSRELVHEVLPVTKPRFALTMWFDAANL